MNIKELKEAILNHDIDTLNKYVKENNIKDLSYTDENGNTFLHLASHKESENTLKVFKKLFELNCDLNSVNEKFQTPLEYAIQVDNKMAIFALKTLELEKEIGC